MSDAGVPMAHGAARLQRMERERRVWLANLRGDLQEPINGLLELVATVVDEGQKHPDAPDDFMTSIKRVHKSAQGLAAIAKDCSDPRTVLFDSHGHFAPVHHEIRSYMTAIIGYCELWSEDADHSVIKAFEDDLRKIRQLGLGIIQFVDSLAKLSGDQCEIDSRNSWLIGGDTIPPPLDGPGPVADAVTGTLLVVDDREVTREVLRRRLEKEGHTVFVAKDGRQALQMIRSQPFDLVLMDLIMPGFTGWQVLERLKANPSLASVPVLMMSSLAEIDSIVRCIEIGAGGLSGPPHQSDPVAGSHQCLFREKAPQ